MPTWIGGGFRCVCKDKSLRDWVVISRAGQHRLSNYYSRKSSLVHCKSCGATGRSRGFYVKFLRDEQDIGSWL